MTGCDRRRHPANGTPDALRSVDCTGCAAHTIAYLSQGLRALPANLIRTRGNFSSPAFACTLDVMGADRVMFSVDYPMDSNKDGADFIASYPMDDSERRKVSCENAIALFGERLPAHLGA